MTKYDVPLRFGLGLGLLVLFETRAEPERSPPELSRLAELDRLPHGIAGDKRLVFVTQPLDGRLAVLDRTSGVEVGAFDDERAPWDRAADVEIVSPRPDGELFDKLKGLTFTRLPAVPPP